MQSVIKHSDLSTHPTTQRHGHELAPLAVVAALHALERLHEAHRHVARLEQRVLLADADARAAVEGEVFPFASTLVFPFFDTMLFLEHKKVGNVLEREQKLTIQAARSPTAPA